jgi:RNA-directed DNA polymerase
MATATEKKAASINRLKAWAAANPERARQTQANWRFKNKDSHRAAVKRWREKNKERAKAVDADRRKRRFFHQRAKAAVWRTKQGDVADLSKSIFWLWRKQRGRCAMTGKRLDRTAELDHIVPVSKGGKNHPDNLQWLSPEVNQCKNDMTVDEFIAVCRNVLSHATR